MTKYTALIIDDHPLISEAYKSAFKHIQKQDENISFDIYIAHDCDTALDIIKERTKQNRSIDIVFLDMSLPPSMDKKILCGEDLGIEINEVFPKAKIIVSTSFNDNYRVHSIFKSINPDGFLIKNDITPKELVTAIEQVLKDPPYYSNTVVKLLRKQVASDFLLDDLDRRILYEISIGTKLKDIENVPISVHGIEKRKRLLKQIFNIKGAEDRELVLIAKEKGFI